ncbi:hypothetical protein H4R34_000357 [Dimargaris verticillata]|uniref:Mis18 domain-containing protein n=1 Tax=Dimargaris verticillata TaxID=2761393 RepID=A0A9W8EBD4_9FUNG|nr:hypothetical protein H4R34_000357 [Dimargaris verticillata]
MPTPPDQASDADDIQAPLVFQCATCATIVGDSFAWVAAVEDLNCVVLNGTGSGTIALGSATTTVDSGPDAGCTYCLLTCTECANPLGKFYQSTTTQWDIVRNSYTLDVSMVKTYELGRTKAPEPTSRSCDSLMDFYSTASVTRSITQMKKMMCVFNDRLERIEKQLE